MQEIKDFFKVRRNLVSLIVIIFLVVVLPFILYLVQIKQIFRPKANELTISTRVPVTIHTTRGTVSSLNSNDLVVNSSDGSVSFSLEGTHDYQRIVSGTLEEDNAVTASTTRTNLQMNQEVLIISDINSPSLAKAVYILK